MKATLNKRCEKCGSEITLEDEDFKTNLKVDLSILNRINYSVICPVCKEEIHILSKIING